MNKKQLYQSLLEEADSVLENERNFVANMANCASLFYHTMNKDEYFAGKINWFGFYLVDKKKENELVLGPFHGLIACTRIRFDRGVCGHCASTKKPVIVPDVHKFPCHIACDSASNSEICVPLMNSSGTLIGLIDVDSTNYDSFDLEDQQALQKLAELVVKSSDLE